MKALVTGGAGFIGSHIVDALLKKRHDVVVVDNFYSGREKNLSDAKKIAQEMNVELTIVKADISLEKTWKELPSVQAIFHIAAQTSVTASVLESDRDFSWNILAAKYLVEFIKKNKIQFLLYSNTAGALYGVPEVIPTNETQPLHPICPYGATKSFLETYIRALTESLKMDNKWSNDSTKANYFSWASLRLGNVYGPRQITKGEAGVVPIFIEKLFSQEVPTIFGSGKETRDYVHVHDVVSAFMTVFEKQQKGKVDEAFNVGTGVATQTHDVFQNVLKNMKDKTTIKEAKHASLRPGELEKSCLDVSKLKKLGWTPSWDFEKGVSQTVKVYLEIEKGIKT
jgi:UDP-glucose 4-epimerase